MLKKLALFVIEVLIVLLSTVFIMKQCQDAKYDKVYQNLIASTDSLKQLRLENGDLLYEKSAYILREKELQSKLDISTNEILDLKNKLNSSLAYISELEGGFKLDTVWQVRDSIVYADSTYHFDFINPFINLQGYHNLGATTITNLDIPLSLKVGLTENKQIFAISSNPYVQITSMEGAVLDGSLFNPKKPRFSHGITAGVGVQYGIVNQQVDIGPYIGYGITINF